jgi:stearoyl-CoA desaturase (delta-9 desaturase)
MTTSDTTLKTATADEPQMSKLNLIEWGRGSFLILIHIAALITVPLYFIFGNPSLGIILTAAAVYLVCNIGVTAGYHRLYAHRSYAIRSRLVEALVLMGGTLTLQDSVFFWAHDHRRHHRYVDTDKDPYAITKGFWHAHFLWMMMKRDTYDPSGIRDLTARPLLRFQNRWYMPLALSLNVAVTIFAGIIFHDFFGAIALVLLARLVLVYQSTWFVNSLAHFWGTKPFSKEHTAVNNWIVALLTGGEGYHNFHHTFPSDYRNGVHWYQWDPTRVFIWTLGKLKLASNLRFVDRATIQERIARERRETVAATAAAAKA